MTNDKILEIARRYTVPKNEKVQLVKFKENNVIEPTDATLNMVMWKFCQEELIAFAQSVLEAEREKRKPLTDEEIDDVVSKVLDCPTLGCSFHYLLARAIEHRITGEEE